MFSDGGTVMGALPSKGFTLIELMIALALGLLITAATIMLFLTSQQHYTLQKANSEIESNASFGLQYLEQKIRLINASEGIVLTGDHPSQNQSSNSELTENSDQLTIQYTANRSFLNSKAALFDCQGQAIIDNTTVIERYYVTSNQNLACRAVRSTDTTTLGNDGSVLIPNVSYFHALLVVRNERGRFEHVSLGNAEQNTIVGLQLGLVFRSRQPVQGQSYINDQNPINILDKTLQLKDTIRQSNQRFLRQTVIQTIALRNGVGN